PPHAVTRMPSFTDETLFYMFYTMPREELQLAAAEELYRRQWRYHKELRLWLTKDPESQPTARTPRGEQSVFIFFDPGVWQKVKKEFLVMYEMLEDRGTAALANSSEPAASANFRAGAQSVPPALQQYQGQAQAGMEQDSGGGGSAAAQAQMQSMLRLSGATASQQQQQQQQQQQKKQQLMMLRQRQQQESAQAASRGMAGQMAYANAQMSEMNPGGSMYNAAASGMRSMPPPPQHMEASTTSVAGQLSSSSNLAEDVATASMV
ncbi:transcriptional regulator, partial [Coemansia sp. RSA 2681]